MLWRAPALVTQRFGRGRTASMLIGDFWQSGLGDEKRQADLLKAWRQIVRWLVADVGYFNKRTDNAYDFNVLFNTPIFFPVAWDHSKIDGFTGKVNLVEHGGVSAFKAYVRARRRPQESGHLRL